MKCLKKEKRNQSFASSLLVVFVCVLFLPIFPQGSWNSSEFCGFDNKHKIF